MRIDHREPPERQSRHDLARFSVKRRSDLVDTVVPFFEQHPLITAKQHDFGLFANVIEMMTAGRHLTEEGLRLIAMTTERMNRQQRSQFLESSEAIRQPPLLDGRGEDMVRTP